MTARQKEIPRDAITRINHFANRLQERLNGYRAVEGIPGNPITIAVNYGIDMACICKTENGVLSLYLFIELETLDVRIPDGMGRAGRRVWGNLLARGGDDLLKSCTSHGLFIPYSSRGVVREDDKRLRKNRMLT